MVGFLIQKLLNFFAEVPFLFIWDIRISFLIVFLLLIIFVKIVAQCVSLRKIKLSAAFGGVFCLFATFVITGSEMTMLLWNLGVRTGLAASVELRKTYYDRYPRQGEEPTIFFSAFYNRVEKHYTYKIIIHTEQKIDTGFLEDSVREFVQNREPFFCMDDPFWVRKVGVCIIQKKTDGMPLMKSEFFLTTNLNILFNDEDSDVSTF